MHLVWAPRITKLEVASRDFVFEGQSYAEATPEFSADISARLASDISRRLLESGAAMIPVNAVPLGEVQVGVSLPGFADTPARHTESLRGIFVVAGRALLIGSSNTTIALDLSFMPGMSNCPVDVSVSRALFAESIVAREPVKLTAQDTSRVRHFFTEISGATRSLAIVHYWFADGVPASVEELPVQASKRWRTWSSVDQKQADVRQWDVLVVERDSGCVLHSASFESARPEQPPVPMDIVRSRQNFKALEDEFNERLIGFSSREEKTALASVEVRHAFLDETLQKAVVGLEIVAEFDRSGMSALQFSSRLQPFDVRDVTCARRECPTPPVCKVNLATCKRLRDTRDCSSCLFRNPLNNRCVSETVDPVCEAARGRQNARYDADREACLAEANLAKQACDRLNQQALTSCRIEAGFEGSVCASIRRSINSLEAGSPLAHVNAETFARGSLTAGFSNFRIEEGLTGLKLDMRLVPNLRMEGELHFSPTDIARPLANCITAWSGPFGSRLATTPGVSNLRSPLIAGGSTLSSSWSGFGVAIATKPSPLESTFDGKPQLLANCRIGLTSDKVEQALATGDEGFFRGSLILQVQPLPTRIHLAPATIGSGNAMQSAVADISGNNLHYRF
jgi:hypothetical protein